MENRHVKIIDFAILVVTFSSLIFMMRYAQPYVIAPVDDLTTTNNSILFEFEKGEFILIDDNLEFSSPEKIYAEDNLVINLKPGVYYWKVQGALDSEVRKLTIQSEIELKLKKSEKEGFYKLTNAGNDRLKVDIYEDGVLNESVVLEKDESREKQGMQFVGGENG